MIRRTIPGGMRRRFAGAQRGAVLLVSLMILLILTMITLVAMRGTTLQERVAGSTRSLDYSLQAAEMALRGVEDIISDGDFKRPGEEHTDSAFELGTVGWYMADPNFFGVERPVPNPQYPNPGDWPDSIYNITAEDFPEKRVYENDPRYFVEALPAMRDPGGSVGAGNPPRGIEYYRITVTGYSGPPDPDDGKAAPFSVILQSTFKR